MKLKNKAVEVATQKLLTKVKEEWGAYDFYYELYDKVVTFMGSPELIKELTSVLKNYDAYSDYKQYIYTIRRVSKNSSN